jgi:hypothetical protein
MSKMSTNCESEIEDGSRISTKNYGAVFFCTETYVRSAHIESFWEMNPLLVAPVKNLAVSYMCSCDVFVPRATKHLIRSISHNNQTTARTSSQHS